MCAVLVSTYALKNKLLHVQRASDQSAGHPDRGTNRHSTQLHLQRRAGIVFIALSCTLKGTTIGKTEGSRVYKAGYKVDSYFVNIPTGLISSTLSAKRALNNNAFSLCLYQGTLLIYNKSKAR